MSGHEENIGKIVLALAGHEVGDWGDCSINDPIVTIIDKRQPAHELVAALRKMNAETAAGIVYQLDPASTYLLTPRLPDGTRLYLRIDATDYAKIKRKVEWSATVFDHDSGNTFRVRGAACDLPECFCDAIAERVA
jgi:hypothetical protein